MRHLPLLLLLACARVPADTAPEPAPRAQSPFEICMLEACAEAEGPEAYEACAQTQCAHREASWALVPTSIRFDTQSGTVFAQARVAHQPEAWGAHEVLREGPAYVGVTVVTVDGEEIDLAVQTLFPDTLQDEFLFSAEVRGEVQDVLFGVWDHKVEPCDVDRSGCREYGFVLDGSLATWPPGLYDQGVRQRILPEQVTLQVHAGPQADPDRVAQVGALARDHLAEQVALFGAQVEDVSANPPEPRAEGLLLAYGHPHDRWVAEALAEALAEAGPVTLERTDDLPADFVVAIGEGS